MSETSQPGTSLSIRVKYERWALVYDHDANPLPALEEPLVREALGMSAGRPCWISDAAPANSAAQVDDDFATP